VRFFLRLKILAVWLATVVSLFGQGSLTPPGAPAPTMKSLEQVASTGIPLNATNAPGDANYHFIINQPGSYFLTGNLGVTKANGIRVNVAGVTIDLNGFEISRSSGTGGDGINIQAVAHRCVVKNGALNGFAQGINSITTAARGCLFHNLSVESCTNYGLRVGEGAVLRSCRARNCSGTAAILAADGATMEDCTATGNSASSAIQAGSGSALFNCAASNGSGTNAINAGGGSVLTDCVVIFNNVSGSALLSATGSALTNCAARNNTAANGLQSGSGSSLQNCIASDNTVTYGILTGVVCALSNCTAAANTSAASLSAGIGSGSGSTITHCDAHSTTSTATLTATTGMGFDVGSGSTIQDSSAYGNSGDGINIANDTFARANFAGNNGAVSTSAGIHATSSDNRIEGNTLRLNFQRNIAVDGTGSLLIKNTATSIGATTNYVIATGNSYGVIVDDTAGSASSVSGTSAVASFASPNAWANFSH
jgi:hypothetical protein